MKKEYAELLVEELELDKFFSNKEEVELINEHNPKLIKAYKALKELATNETDISAVCKACNKAKKLTLEGKWKVI